MRTTPCLTFSGHGYVRVRTNFTQFNDCAINDKEHYELANLFWICQAMLGL